MVEILSKANRDSLEIRGNAEGQSIQIFAAALQQDPEFFTFLRSLEAYGKLLNSRDTIVIDSDAALFRFLVTATGEQ